MTDRALSFKQLQNEKVKFCRSHIFELERQGRFPKRRAYGRRVFWMESEVDEWIRDNLTKEVTAE